MKGPTFDQDPWKGHHNPKHIKVWYSGEYIFCMSSFQIISVLLTVKFFGKIPGFLGKERKIKIESCLKIKHTFVKMMNLRHTIKRKIKVFEDCSSDQFALN